MIRKCPKSISYVKFLCLFIFGINYYPDSCNQRCCIGGKRKGAGRPIDPNKETKIRVYLPSDIADMLKDPTFIASLRGLKQVFKHHHR